MPGTFKSTRERDWWCGQKHVSPGIKFNGVGAAKKTRKKSKTEEGMVPNMGSRTRQQKYGT